MTTYPGTQRRMVVLGRIVKSTKESQVIARQPNTRQRISLLILSAFSKSFAKDTEIILRCQIGTFRVRAIGWGGGIESTGHGNGCHNAGRELGRYVMTKGGVTVWRGTS